MFKRFKQLGKPQHGESVFYNDNKYIGLLIEKDSDFLLPNGVFLFLSDEQLITELRSRLIGEHTAKAIRKYYKVSKFRADQVIATREMLLSELAACFSENSTIGL